MFLYYLHIYIIYGNIREKYAILWKGKIMTGSIKVSIPSDDDGFITFQCPFCSEHFKLDSEEVQNDSLIEIYCPLCGLKDEQSGFLTDDVREHMKQIMENMAKGMLNDWAKDLEKQFRGNKSVSFKAGKPLKQVNPKNLYEREHDFDIIDLDCCNHKVKIKKQSVNSKVYCPYCGVK